MTLTTLSKEERLCPLGMAMRTCQYQETYAKDLITAITGDLVFVCILDPRKECPKLEEMVKLWE